MDHLWSHHKHPQASIWSSAQVPTPGGTCRPPTSSLSGRNHPFLSVSSDALSSLPGTRSPTISISFHKEQKKHWLQTTSASSPVINLSCGRGKEHQPGSLLQGKVTHGEQRSTTSAAHASGSGHEDMLLAICLRAQECVLYSHTHSWREYSDNLTSVAVVTLNPATNMNSLDLGPSKQCAPYSGSFLHGSENSCDPDLPLQPGPLN